MSTQAWLLPRTQLPPALHCLEIGVLCRAFRVSLEIALADDWTNEESNMSFLIEGQGLW